MAGTGGAANSIACRNGLNMAAKYILAVLAAVFLALAGLRIMRDGARIMPASRNWLLTGIIFAVVSAYLWMSA